MFIHVNLILKSLLSPLELHTSGQPWDLINLFVQVVHSEEPDPLHPLGGRVQQPLLLQSKLGTQGWTKPELSPYLPECPGPESAAGGALLHRIIPVCGCGLHLRLGQSQLELKDVKTHESEPTAGNIII